ncbi:minor capsid protein [Streptomyces sparsogenes]|uniref:minor capsid protein n=1 Tax=Streptomyces sparsogenes TaxID=67365 RepID=UPI00340983BF
MTQYTRLTYNGRRLWTSGGRRRAARGVHLAAEHILAESKKEVPLEEGTLERSGKATVDETALTGAVSYDTVYAVRQHEELTWHHPMPGRKAKYLEDPMNRERQRVAQIIAAEIRRWLR